MRRWLLVLALCGAGWGQAPTFAAVSIKPVTGPLGTIDTIRISGPNVIMVGYEIAGLIAEAYGLKSYQLARLTVPNLKDFQETYWNIDAVAPGERSYSREEIRPMLQAMLAERFGLVVHRETRDFPAYALEAGPKGPKFEASAADGTCSMRGAPAPGGQSYTFKNCGMDRFAEQLSHGLLDRNVVLDKTGLTGGYDFVYTAMPTFMSRNRTPDASDIDPKGAIEALGLKVEPITTPIETIVVDKVSKPTANQ